MDLTLSLSPSSSSLVTSRLGYSSSSSSLATNSNANSRKARISTRRSKALTCNALFGLGLPELAVIAGVAALAFGPKNLPQVGRSLGKTIKSFQQVRFSHILFWVTRFCYVYRAATTLASCSCNVTYCETSFTQLAHDSWKNLEEPHALPMTTTHNSRK